MTFENYGGEAVRKELEAIKQNNRLEKAANSKKSRFFRRLVLCCKLKKRNQLR